jgi:hypothetical protein
MALPEHHKAKWRVAIHNELTSLKTIHTLKPVPIQFASQRTPFARGLYKHHAVRLLKLRELVDTGPNDIQPINTDDNQHRGHLDQGAAHNGAPPPPRQPARRHRHQQLEEVVMLLPTAPSEKDRLPDLKHRHSCSFLLTARAASRLGSARRVMR